MGCGPRSSPRRCLYSNAINPCGLWRFQERQKGFEPSTFGLGSRNHPDASADSKALAPTPFPVCTRVCTSEPENANADALEAASLGSPPQAADALEAGHHDEGEGIGAPSGSGDTLAKLAAALLTLSPADRAKLAAMLTTGTRAKAKGKPPRPRLLGSP
jgi:hypothetical protein